ncbi:MAG: hypothetical protein KBA15_03620, partial [Spirochaetes bacterium]|nr:hypothetical protein [Spirochaetota bacterium]
VVSRVSGGRSGAIPLSDDLTLPEPCFRNAATDSREISSRLKHPQHALHARGPSGLHRTMSTVSFIKCFQFTQERVGL